MITQILNQGLSLYQQGQFPQALRLITTALQDFPDNPQLTSYAGGFALAAGDEASAEKYFRQAIQLSPNYPDIYNNYASLLQNQRRFDEAETHLKKAISLRENYPEALNSLAKLLFELNRYDEAENYFRLALQYNPQFIEVYNSLGVILQKKGDPLSRAKAEVYFLQCLKHQPVLVDALNNLGNLYQEQKLRYLAEMRYRQAIQNKPDFPEAHKNLGNLLKQHKRYAEAEQHYLKALVYQPNFLSPLFSLADLYHLQKKYSEAEKRYQQVLQYVPDFTDIIIKLADLYFVQKRYQEAEQTYQQALSTDPNSVTALLQIAKLFNQQQRYQEAEIAYQQVIQLQPSAETYNNLGAVLDKLELDSEAENAFFKSLEINPELAEAHLNLGRLCVKRNQVEAAYECYENALLCRENYPEAYFNLANLFKDEGLMAEAEAAFKKALSLNPKMVDAWNNLANLYYQLTLLADAEIAYRKAIKIAPDKPDSQFNLANLLLSQEQFEEGWALFEARYHPDFVDCQLTPVLDRATFWTGQHLEKMSLLIWPEQGLGDEIQFIRYLPLLKSQGVRHITYVCKPPLKRLFSNYPYIDELLTADEYIRKENKSFDYWCFLLSLPGRMNTDLSTIPREIPYLSCSEEDKARWLPHLPQTTKRKVGLVWQGNKTHKNDQNRSLPSIQTLAPLWQHTDIEFISLQKDLTEVLPDDQPLTHLGDLITDFTDTAAIISQLDLVISVDTAIVHLAGALNRPCWVLLPQGIRDWRWGHNRTDTPWYSEKMQLFSQQQSGDWTPVIETINHALDHIE